MADDSLHKSFDIVKLTITALMLDLVSLKLVVAEEGFEQFAGVHPILKIIIIHLNHFEISIVVHFRRAR